MPDPDTDTQGRTPDAGRENDFEAMLAAYDRIIADKELQQQLLDAGLLVRVDPTTGEPLDAARSVVPDRLGLVAICAECSHSEADHSEGDCAYGWTGEPGEEECSCVDGFKLATPDTAVPLDVERLRRAIDLSGLGLIEGSDPPAPASDFASAIAHEYARLSEDS